MDATFNYTYHKDATLPSPNEIFVFGSNLAGAHGAGAARAALRYGAKLGAGNGLVGRTYAIPTKDHSIQTLSLVAVEQYINDFVEFATMQSAMSFFVTRIGCGLAGYTDAQIAPLFYGAPPNCNFAEQWKQYLE